MTKLGFTDTLTGKTYNCGTWAKDYFDGIPAFKIA